MRLVASQILCFCMSSWLAKQAGVILPIFLLILYVFLFLSISLFLPLYFCTSFLSLYFYTSSISNARIPFTVPVRHIIITLWIVWWDDILFFPTEQRRLMMRSLSCCRSAISQLSHSTDNHERHISNRFPLFLIVCHCFSFSLVLRTIFKPRAVIAVIAVTAVIVSSLWLDR